MEYKNHSHQQNQTRNDIFMNAARLFSEKGYNRVSIRDICESVGVGKPTLYYYFKDKETLFVQLVQEAKSLGRALFEEFMGKDLSPIEKLENILRFFQTYVERYPVFIRFFSQISLMSLPESIELQISPFKDELLDTLQEIVKEGQEHGGFSHDLDRELFALTMLSTIKYFLHLKSRDSGNEFDLAGMFDRLLDLWKKILLET